MTDRCVETRPVSLADFDGMPDGVAEALVRPACLSERWIAYVVRKRPYHSLSQLIAASDEAIRILDWPDIEQAIGPQSALAQRLKNRSGRQEVGGVYRDESVRAELEASAERYEHRFGHRFLICPAGRSGTDVLGQLHVRLGHATEVERRIVRAELRKIVRLALTSTFRATDSP